MACGEQLRIFILCFKSTADLGVGHITREIPLSYDGEDVSIAVPVCDAMWTSRLKMETVCSSETLVSSSKVHAALQSRR
jgi:hypothetical protein